MLPSRSGIYLWAIYRNYPNIIVIKNKKKIIQVVPFPVIYDDVLKEIKTLDTAEASQQSDVATKIVKQDSDYFAEYFYENINQCILTWIFPPHLESRSNNKKLKNSKDNYRPVSILSNVSKIYERCIYNQIQFFFYSALSKYRCGFRKGYNAHTAW